ncbi:Fic family protein [Candidatus Parcubacteria bacterium]|nr:MAG: Fic family protein [Candidatus Parcubacteria bacterium]
MSNINKPKIGRYIQQKDEYKAFTPFEFPPKEGFPISDKLHKKNEEAIRLVGKLDGITRLLPDKDFFLHMFIKKDAAYSSQIEGTQATLQDAIAAPVTEEKSRLHPDVDDIVHYVEAINYGIKRVETLPISLRLIREIHQILMTGARSTQHAYPGEFRNSQNWIGGKTPGDATFVPPAPNDMHKSLYELEKFIHAQDQYPSLVRAGLIHAQFETIHPFTDGNGRAGRMLIVMYIHHAKLLELPILYLSSYFKKHQKLYYQKLQNYHDEQADIDAWLEFFLDGVAEMAQSSIKTCAKITSLRDRDFAKMQKLGRKSAQSTLEIIRKLFNQPIVGVGEIMKWTGFSLQGSYNMIDRLRKLGILEPLGVSEYGQKYIYADYYEIFDEEFKLKRKK